MKTSTGITFPRRGEIYLVEIPDDPKERPAIVLSSDVLNRFALDVVVVPVTTVERGRFSTRILLTPGEGGLRKRCYAKCDQVTNVNKRRLLRGPFRGSLSRAKLAEIEDGVRLALEL